MKQPSLTFFKRVPANNTEAARLIIDVLTASKKYLWNGNETTTPSRQSVFVCYAVTMAMDAQEWDEDVKDYTIDFVHDYIHLALGGFTTLDSWLDSANRKVATTLTRADRQALRLKWMNKMIRDLTKRYL